MMALLSLVVLPTEVYGMGGTPYKLSEREADAIAAYKRQLQNDFEFRIEAWKSCSDKLHAQSIGRAAWACKRFKVLSMQYPCKVAIQELEEKTRNREYLQDPDYQAWVRDKDLSIHGFAPQTLKSFNNDPELREMCLAIWLRGQVGEVDQQK